MREFKMKTPPKGPNPPAGPNDVSDKVHHQQLGSCDPEYTLGGFRCPTTRDFVPAAAILTLSAQEPAQLSVVERVVTRDRQVDLLDETGGIYGLVNIPVPPRDDGRGEWGVFETGLGDDKYTQWLRLVSGGRS